MHIWYSRWTNYSNPGQLYPSRPRNFKVVFFFQGLRRVDKTNQTPQHDISRTRSLTLTFGEGGVVQSFPRGLNILSIYGILNFQLSHANVSSMARKTLRLARCFLLININFNTWYSVTLNHATCYASTSQMSPSSTKTQRWHHGRIVVTSSGQKGWGRTRIKPAALFDISKLHWIFCFVLFCCFFLVEGFHL